EIEIKEIEEDIHETAKDLGLDLTDGDILPDTSAEYDAEDAEEEEEFSEDFIVEDFDLDEEETV
ncbi:MAG: hypothetical protein ACYC4H_08970, partial [Desulfocucumaceae bacterium]